MAHVPDLARGAIFNGTRKTPNTDAFNVFSLTCFIR